MIVKELKEILKNVPDNYPVVFSEVNKEKYKANNYYITEAAILHSDSDWRGNADVLSLANFKNTFKLPNLFSDGIEISEVLASYKAED